MVSNIINKFHLSLVNHLEPVCKVILFQHSNYEGSRQLHTSNGTVRKKNDASSLKVTPGCCVILFTGEDFKGRSKEFCTSSSFVGNDLNDKTSSIKIQRSKKCSKSQNDNHIKFFQCFLIYGICSHCNYQSKQKLVSIKSAILQI